jgi:hypothetical protein
MGDVHFVQSSIFILSVEMVLLPEELSASLVECSLSSW